MNYYFAYGSNLYQPQMKERCPDYKYIGNGVLKDYRLAFTTYSRKWQCGCADILPAKGEEVWGAIYALSDADFANMNKSEGANYRRFTVEIFDENDVAIDVLTYIVINKRYDLLPSKAYMAQIINGATELKLPEYYIDRLKEVSTLE